MDKRVFWAGLVILCVLVLGSVVHWLLSMQPRTGVASLPIERVSLGRTTLTLPETPLANHAPVPLIDLNADGAPEALWLLVPVGAVNSVALWTDLNGTFSELPIGPLLPYPGMSELPSIILKELIGWRHKTRDLVRLTREGDQWRVEPLTPPSRAPATHAEWVDGDADRRLDGIIVFDRQGNPFYLALGNDGRWRWQARPPQPIAHASANSQVRGLIRRIPVHGRIVAVAPREWIDDLDGDGRPERYDLLRQVLLLSRDGSLALPMPLAFGATIAALEMDGQPPRELVYIGAQPAGNHIDVSVYRYANRKLNLVARHQVVGWAPSCMVGDLGGDGRGEIVLGTIPLQSRHLHLRLFALENGVLHEQQRAVQLPRTCSPSSFDIVQLAPKSVFACTVRARRDALRMGRHFDLTVLVGLPPAPDAVRDVNQWQVAFLNGRVKWSGDCDGDGTPEYVLTDADGSKTSWVAQYKDGMWRAARVKGRAPILSVAAAPYRGTPALLLLYASGEAESVLIKR
ncbi:MAG: hypothetical protein NZ874_02475 [Fimbriimonadales bacterium]|nr:hypothetical protein [Fimbriimonadales bacterium]